MYKCLLLYLSLIIPFISYSQCPLDQPNTDGNSISGDYGQSFQATCTGLIRSFSFNAIAATVPLTGTMEIFKGEGVAGTPEHTQTFGISVAIGANTITLEEPFEVFIKEQYSIRLTTSIAVTLARDAGNPYAAGQMYVSGSAVSGQDLTFSTVISENYPSGVSSNLALWLRADAGTNTTIDGASVTTWNDLSRSETNYVSSGTNSTYDSIFSNNFPSIALNLNANILSTTETTYTDGSLYAVVNHSDNATSNSFFGNISAGSSVLLFEQNTDSDGYGYSATSGTDYTAGISSNHDVVKILSFETSNGTGTMNVQDIIAGTRNSSDFSVGATNRTISNKEIGGFSDVAEIILYGGAVNTALERQKIESYLSIKYGLPYDKDLLASNDSVIWDRVTNAGFNNDIAAIGRDDTAGVHLKKSRSANPDGLVTVEKTDFFANDRSFISWGNDGSSLNQPNIADVDGAIIQVRMERTWIASVLGTPENVDITFDLTSIPGTKSVTDLRLLVDRDNDGFSDNDVLPMVGTLNGEEFKVSGVSMQNGDRFTVGSTNRSATPLPIELGYFRAELVNEHVQLEWQSVQELDNDYYMIEKSIDGTNWELLLSRKGAGTSANPIHYKVHDPSPHHSACYYQLKQVDYDGEISTYNTVYVGIENKYKQLVIAPNPVTEVLRCMIPFGEGTATVLSLTGGLVMNRSFQSVDGIITLQLADDLPSGMYILVVQSKHGLRQTTFLKQ